MADILFVTWDGGGNVPPALRMAGELARRGHRTRFLGHRSQGETITALGHEFTAYAEAADFVGSEPASPWRMIPLFSDRGMGRDLLGQTTREPADVVVIDALLVAAVHAAASAGLRYVTLQHLFDRYQRGGWLNGPVGLMARTRGIRPVAGWAQAAVAIGATLPELDPGASRAADNLRFVGPVVEVPERRAHFAGRKVLVSFSTVHYPGMQQALQRVVDATAGLDVDVVLTTGPAVDPAALRLHDRVEAHRYLEHEVVMPEVSLVIGHGGHSTAMRALAYDLPVLTVPMHPLLDQPMVGRALQTAGAGRVVRKSTSAKRLRPHIAELVEVGPHREAAAHLGALIRQARPAGAAADLVESVLSAPTPPSPAPAPGRRGARP